MNIIYLIIIIYIFTFVNTITNRIQDEGTQDTE